MAVSRFLRLAAAAVAAALVLWAAVAFLTRENAPRPPLGGAMAKFTVAGAGSPAPQAPLTAADGTTTTLAALRGRVLLVNFWATWCAPCVKELPSLLRLESKLRGQDLAVLALSQDLKGWPVIAPFLDRHGLRELTVLHDVQGAAGRALSVRGLPTTVLFDREGREIGRLVGDAQWDSGDAVALIRHYLDSASAR